MSISSVGSAYQPYTNDPQSIALQQAELQAKILSILNPNTKLTTESKPATNDTASVASSKPSIPVLTPSNSASTAFKAPSAPAPSTPQSQTSNIIGMALSSIRAGATSQSGISSQGSTAKPSYTNASLSYSNTNPSYSGANSYSGYPSTAGQSQSWSQAQYRSPAPSPSQHRGIAPHPPSQPVRPTASAGYPRYPAAQMNSRGGYRAAYPSGYPPQARY